jgi:hypothetical protein
MVDRILYTLSLTEQARVVRQLTSSELSLRSSPQWGLADAGGDVP